MDCAVITSCPCFFLMSLKILLSEYNLIINSKRRSLNILLSVRSSQSKQTKQLFMLRTDICASTFQKPSSEQKTYSLLQLKQVKKLCSHGNFLHIYALL